MPDAVTPDPDPGPVPYPPDVLRVFRAMLALVDAHPELGPGDEGEPAIVREARAAIAKAAGETVP